LTEASEREGGRVVEGLKGVGLMIVKRWAKKMMEATKEER